ncbi:hypothetical protein BDV41DRAFT_542746 [Aspergillus transmontanensis]|uniref:Uncharacterized protein n=1 Tax=Aspergillus transmontanensis TaxID=1034304 RepID=A0A5N6VRD6_9EURO|nr:hypothetical protein BDV41DRAFT_542746 [Aspergillus transmontanensis]
MLTETGLHRTDDSEMAGVVHHYLVTTCIVYIYGSAISRVLSWSMASTTQPSTLSLYSMHTYYQNLS